MVPRLMVFDMAGTTVADSGHVAGAMAETLKEAGIPARAPMLTKYLGLPKPTALRNALKDLSDPRHEEPAFIKELHDQFTQRMIAHFEQDRGVSEIPGAMRTFDWLHQNGCMVALDTGFSRPIANAILKRLNWVGGAIDFTVTSDEVNRGRPMPDMIFEAMKRFSIESPQHVGKIGDTPNDLIQGHAAGCKWIIGVTEGSHIREQLSAYPHTHLINNVGKLPQVFLEDEDYQ